MIFSGMVTNYGCSRCDFTCSKAQSTSLMLFIGLVGIGVAAFLPRVAQVVDLRWHVTLGIIIGEVLLLFIALFLSGWIADRLDRIPDKCPKCRASVAHEGSGFYDFSFIPHITDIIIAVIFVTFNLPVSFILKYLSKL